MGSEVKVSDNVVGLEKPVRPARKRSITGGVTFNDEIKTQDGNVIAEEASEAGLSYDENEGRNKERDSPLFELTNLAKNLIRVRFLTALILVGSTVGVAMAVFFYMRYIERDRWEGEFQQESLKVTDAVGAALDQAMGAIDSVMVSLAGSAMAFNQTWPFVVQPHFPARVTKALSLSKGVLLQVLPRVNSNQRVKWEEFAVKNSKWVDEALEVQQTDPTFNGKVVTDWTTSGRIFDTSDSGSVAVAGERELFYPVWQVTPVVRSDNPFGMDFYTTYARELDAMTEQRALTFGRVSLEDPDDSEDFDMMTQLIRDVVGESFAGLGEPVLNVFYPIFANAQEKVKVPDDPVNFPVVGSVNLVIFWKEFFQDILPEGDNGVIVVVSGGCGKTFTYQINGPETIFLGPGDLHDNEYNYLEEKFALHELQSMVTAAEMRRYTGVPISSEFCPLSMTVYASDTFRGEYETQNPLYFTLFTIAIFVFTWFLFLGYDIITGRRQQKVLQAALQSTAIVTSLFPSVIRDRVFPHNRDVNVETAKLRLQSFMRGGEKGGGGDDDSDDESDSAPIAELFPDTTVMFGDIAGFTAWSSVREPAQVFTLLENLYGAFDKIASRRGVFKVETIGDSYVAVAGLPDPRPDHALVMAKFARDIREKMDEITKNLEITLGPDTGDLKIRIGLNSGPVTAGVLRGERSRFQLFGDTVNTAARMESTGQVSKIQATQTTAQLLIRAGKAHWLKRRHDEIYAKGKGTLQTYWVEPKATVQTVAPDVQELKQSIENGKSLDPKVKRLVEWNVEMLAKLVKQVVARRMVTLNRRATMRDVGKVEKEEPRKEGDTVLDEVREIIELPEFNQALARNQKDPRTIDLGDKVMSQLKDYVTMIASMYHTSNPFHNFEHASHVTMSVVKLLSRIVSPDDVITTEQTQKASKLASSLHDHTYGITSDPLTQFACVYSALIHDVDHPGVPNSQLVKENSPLVPFYKGKSVAEQNSVDISWNLLIDGPYEELRKVIFPTPAEKKRFRQLVVNSVMATDVMDKDLKNLRNQRWDKAFAEGSNKESTKQNVDRKATIVIEHLIQASDVAHTMQHWHIYRKWNERLFEELYEAFKAGRSGKSPVDFWYKGEIGFFDFYIIPLAKKLSDCGVFGVSSDEYLNYAMRNRDEWENRGQEVVESMITKFVVDTVAIADAAKEEKSPVMVKEAAMPEEAAPPKEPITAPVEDGDMSSVSNDEEQDNFVDDPLISRKGVPVRDVSGQ